MRAYLFVAAAALLTVLATAGRTHAQAQAQSQSQTIPVAEAPKAVIDAVKAKFPDAEIQKAKKKVENGKTFFGIGLTSKGTERSLTLTEKGKIVEAKSVVAASALPAKVAEAVYAAYPNSTTKKAQKVTAYKEEKSFKVEVVTSDKQTKTIVLDAEGKVLSAAK